MPRSTSSRGYATSATGHRSPQSRSVQAARSASVCDTPRLLQAAVILIACGVASACARPVGDFGRAQPGVLHDDIMPAVGSLRAEMAGEPVSAFNWTDEEREMHDRVWRFLVAPHARDWFMDTVVELQRTRIIAASDHKFSPSRYYRWLHEARFASSHTRYSRLADDVRSDADTAPAAFRSVCRVLEIDWQRGVASRDLGDLSAGEVAARRAENDLYIAWFTRALRYRYDSYGFALDRLLVETPHEEARKADRQLDDLGVYVELAERGDFCGTVEGVHVHGGKDAIPSRVMMQMADNPAYRK